MEAKNVSHLVEKLKADKEKKDDFLQATISFLKNVEDDSLITNKWIFLTIVVIVGAVLLASITLGAIIIFGAENSQEAKIPEFLVSICSTV